MNKFIKLSLVVITLWILFVGIASYGLTFISAGLTLAESGYPMNDTGKIMLLLSYMVATSTWYFPVVGILCGTGVMLLIDRVKVRRKSY